MENEGFGKLVTRDEMQEDNDRGFPKKEAITAYFKPSPSTININILKRVRDPDLNETFYMSQFWKPTDEKLHKMVLRYHPNVEDLTASQCGPFNEGKIIVKFARYMIF